VSTMIIFLASSMVLLGLAACSVQPSGTPSAKRLTQADNGHEADLHVGDILDVILPGNPSTGFQWQIDAGDNKILPQSAASEFEPATNALGSGGQVTMHFKAVAAGRTGLKLTYRRPFEKDAPPARTFQVTVNVK
jgi:predicted secreted protein